MKKQIIATAIALMTTTAAHAELSSDCVRQLESAAVRVVNFQETAKTGQLTQAELDFYGADYSRMGEQTAAYCVELTTIRRNPSEKQIQRTYEEALAYYNNYKNQISN